MIFEVENYATMQEAVAQFCRFLDEYNVPSERVFDSRLVINELIGNVLKHGSSRRTRRFFRPKKALVRTFTPSTAGGYISWTRYVMNGA